MKYVICLIFIVDFLFFVVNCVVNIVVNSGIVFVDVKYICGV